jgi:hypothetical protein
MTRGRARIAIVTAKARTLPILMFTPVRMTANKALAGHARR